MCAISTTAARFSRWVGSHVSIAWQKRTMNGINGTAINALISCQFRTIDGQASFLPVHIMLEHPRLTFLEDRQTYPVLIQSLLCYFETLVAERGGC